MKTCGKDGLGLSCGVYAILILEGTKHIKERCVMGNHTNFVTSNEQPHYNEHEISPPAFKEI